MYRICLKSPLTKEDKDRIYERMRLSGREPGIDEETIQYLENQCLRNEKEIRIKDMRIDDQNKEINGLCKFILGLFIFAVIASASFGYFGYRYGVSRNSTPSSVNNEIEKNEGKSGTTYVYVSENGEKYHRYSCRYVTENMEEVTLDEAIDSGYQPCKVCKP